MSIAPPQPRVRAMSAIRRPTSTSSTSSSTNRSRTSIGGVGSEQTTPRSSVSSHRPRSSHSMIERPASLGGRGTLEQSASGMARPSPLSSSRPLPPGRSTSGGAKKASPFPPIELERSISPGTNEALEGALRREVEEKEELMMRLAQRDEAISQLEARLIEMDNTMIQGESQLTELYADQERWEAERDSLEKSIAKKTTIIEKLRIQLRELDKENRDYTRRLTEQAAQFESERQAFYDNTTHLKSRIQSLTDQQREWKEHRREEEVKEEAPPSATGEPAETRLMIPFPREDDRVEDREPEEPAEMSALRLELSTLSTSHGSLGQTVKMLQGQLADLQRVNLTLQEENEAFTTLLKEKTLSGQIDILRRGSRSPSPEPSEEGTQEEASSGLLSPMQSPPPRARTHSRALKPMRAASPAPSGKSARSAKRIAAETLADLPVAGPGLDLAAELGRAVNRLEDDLVPPEEEAKEEEKKEEETVKIPNAEFEALKAEVKHLKDANKALTLYASKIIDRIITQDAFEHILAVDYTKPEEKEKPKPAPQPKSFFQRAASLSISGGAAPKVAARPPLKVSTDAANAGTSSGLNSPATPMDRRERRGLSMDWRRLSLFTKAPATPVEDVRTAGLKPLTLGKTISNEPMPSTPKDEPFPIVHGGRKLDNQEDEEDQVERERLHAHLKLMGVQPSAATTSFAAAGSALASSESILNRSDSSLNRSGTSSPSWWNKRPESSELRAEHLELGDDEHEVREAETRIAQMEQKEKHLSAEMAKGKGGGFTEPPPKGSRVRRRAGSGASGASTLFSAGRMSRGGSEGGIDEEKEL